MGSGDITPEKMLEITDSCRLFMTLFGPKNKKFDATHFTMLNVKLTATLQLIIFSWHSHFDVRFIQKVVECHFLNNGGNELSYIE
jgi:hypothetical protein